MIIDAQRLLGGAGVWGGGGGGAARRVASRQPPFKHTEIVPASISWLFI